MFRGSNQQPISPPIILRQFHHVFTTPDSYNSYFGLFNSDFKVKCAKKIGNVPAITSSQCSHFDFEDCHKFSGPWHLVYWMFRVCYVWCIGNTKRKDVLRTHMMSKPGRSVVPPLSLLQPTFLLIPSHLSSALSHAGPNYFEYIYWFIFPASCCRSILLLPRVAPPLINPVVTKLNHVRTFVEFLNVTTLL